MIESGGDAERAAEGTPTWWVRHAGRVSGPFTVERLRTMAQRGSLTRVHQVSPDCQGWLPACDVRAVFNPDGTIASAGGARHQAARVPPRYDATPPASAFWQVAPGAREGAPRAATNAPDPSAVRARSAATATVRAAQMCAIVIGALALMAPTARDAAGDLTWWPRQEALSIAVHGLAAAVLVAWWIALALPPAPALGSALAAVCALLAAAVTLPNREWAPWMTPTAALLATNAVVLALTGTHASGALARMAGLAGAALGILGAAIVGVLVWQDPAGWGIASGALVAVGAIALNIRAPFLRAVMSSTPLTAALFVAAAGGLVGPEPMRGAAGAVAALLALVLSVLAWAGARQGAQAAVHGGSAHGGAPRTP